MGDLIIKAAKPQAGYRQIVDVAQDELEFLGFGLAQLAAGESWDVETGDCEWVAVVLGGTIRAFGPGGEITTRPLGERANVFGGRAGAVYLPPGFTGRIEAVTDATIGVCQGRVDSGAEPAAVYPEDVKIKTVGAYNWERQVHDIVDARIDAGCLVVGETFNKTGGWSSYPPHRHDENNPPVEVEMEEVYFFQVNPPQGFGFQRIYTDDRDLDVSYAVENGDTVMLPRGYHPVAAAPGYQLYYLWMLAGKDRTLAPNDDPDHHWVQAAAQIVREAT